MGYTVAIVGRPNVGKSTLFNRLIGERQAIIDNISGVTRDRQYGVSNWAGKDFNVIDTGGFVLHSEDIFEKEIRQQVEIAMEEASLILFMVDVTCGITDLELDIAKLLRKSDKEVLVVINKVDNTERVYDANEFYSLGFDEIYSVSSISGSGTGELLDAIAERIEEEPEEVQDDIPRVAIIGQPNVGKSSLLNALLGEQRNIVTDMAGTTRDAVHTRYNLFNKDLLLVDTAGIRKKGKVRENLEFYTVIRAIKAIDEADVCVLIIDATLGIEAQDLKILSMAIRKGKGIVIAVNKWDLIEDKDSNRLKRFEDEIKTKIAPFSDVPIHFISALNKQRIFRVIESAIEVYKHRRQKIKTSQLNDIMLAAAQKNPPPATKGKFIRIKYVTQLPTHTPVFAFFCNHPKYIKEPYRNYLENNLRRNFNFSGVPVKLVFREK